MEKFWGLPLAGEQLASVERVYVGARFIEVPKGTVSVMLVPEIAAAPKVGKVKVRMSLAELVAMEMGDEVPVLPPLEVAVRVRVSTTLFLVVMEKVPLLRVLVLSPKVPLPSLSNWALPVLLVIVTTVELSVVIVFPKASLAVTVVEKGAAVPWGEPALTV